jgi:uncharacterized repeat protein (TIGR01451 family)
LIWAKSIGDVMTVCRVDQLGDIYVGGVNNGQAFAAKLGSNGDTIWTLTSSGGANSPSVTGIDYDNNGNAFVLASFGQGIQFGGHSGSGTTNSFFLAKINSSRQVLSFITSDNQSNVTPGPLRVNRQTGDIYFAGSFYQYLFLNGGLMQSSSSGALFLAKMSSAGNYNWINIDSGGSSDYLYGLDIDSRGNVYSTGRADGTYKYAGTTFNSFSNLFISKTSSSGIPLWSNAVQISCGSSYQFNTIAIDKFDRIYTDGSGCGMLFPDGHNLVYSEYIAQWDTAGHFIFANGIAHGIEARGFDINNGGLCIIASEYQGGTEILGLDTLPLLGSRTDQKIVISVVNTPTAIVQGSTFYDVNHNGLRDMGEPSLQGIVLYTNNADFYSLSDSVGRYRIWIDSGTYQLGATPPRYWTISEPAGPSTYAITAYDTPKVFINKDFGFAPVSGISDAKITLSNVTSSIVGQYLSYYIDFKNEGTDTLSGTIEFYTDAVQIYISSNPSYDSVSGNKKIWHYSQLIPNEHRGISVITQIPWTTPFNTPLNVSASIYHPGSDSTPQNNVDILSLTALSAFDPNIKTVSQQKISTTELNSGSNYLRYKVEFQNTGNDTAINVTVLDTISRDLDLRSFHLISYSNPVDVKIKNGRVIEGSFYNILLPDSHSNQLRSHGFFEYELLANRNLAVNDTFHNTASIYFDFNTPVVTNDAFCVVVNPSAINDVSLAFEDMKIIPNPNNGSFNINIESDYNREINVTVYDLLGRVILTKPDSLQSGGNNLNLNAQQIDAGIYLVNISDSHSLSITKRFIKE